MFPLKSRILIRGAAAHVKAGLGIGADYVANYAPLYASHPGKIETFYGSQGGNWTRLIRDNGDKIEFAHLSKYIYKGGRVSAGEQIAVTGNTGAITSHPHLHIQILRNGKRLDPETYDWDTSPLKTTFMKITVVANNITWLKSEHLTQLNDFFKLHSGGRLEVIGDIRSTNFKDIPLSDFSGLKAIDVNWYRSNISRLATGQISVFLMNPEDYPNGSTWGFMTYGDPGKPVRTELASQDILSPEGIPMFVLQTFHEICHALFFLTGQTDRVHEFLNRPDPQYQALLDLIDYSKLQQALIKIKPESMSQAKVVKSKNSQTVYICYAVPSMQHLQERASLEGIEIPNPIPNTDSL